MKVMFKIDEIDLSHIEQALKFAKEIEHKEGRLSRLEIQYPKEIVYYNFWHNKKSISITSQRGDNNG